MNRLLFALLIGIGMAFPSESTQAQPPKAPVKTPVVIEHDVHEFGFDIANIPFKIDRESQPTVRAVRLFVSEDNGKTWKLADERELNENRFIFQAARDGLYWFAVQSVEFDGKSNPADSKGLVTKLKIYINKERQPIMRKPAPKS